VCDHAPQGLLVLSGIKELALKARCAFLNRTFHSRMPLRFTSLLLRLKRCYHACDQWHSSRLFKPFYRYHRKFRPNAEGTAFGFQPICFRLCDGISVVT
jgi:hypothetical protein